MSKIYSNHYELVAIDDISSEFKAGEVLPLDKTYCREVMATGQTIALSEINGVSGFREHPLYVENTVEAYIGAPILVNSNIWGTINFSSVRI